MLFTPTPEMASGLRGVLLHQLKASGSLDDLQAAIKQFAERSAKLSKRSHA